MLEIKVARGKVLDMYAEFMGLKRKRYFFIFKENDNKLKSRIMNKLKSISRKE